MCRSPDGDPHVERSRKVVRISFMSSVLRSGATSAPLHGVDNVAVTSVGHDDRHGQSSSPNTLASSDQIRPRDARQVCPVLWSELRVDGQKSHSAPICHV
jgi:hypothetical protein